MRKEGIDRNTATDELRSKSIAYKNELLSRKGINYDDLTSWQRYGVGVYFRTVKKEGFNPFTNEKVLADRRELYANLELPVGDEYRAFITNLLNNAE